MASAALVYTRTASAATTAARVHRCRTAGHEAHPTLGCTVHAPVEGLADEEVLEEGHLGQGAPEHGLPVPVVQRHALRGLTFDLVHDAEAGHDPVLAGVRLGGEG